MRANHKKETGAWFDGPGLAWMAEQIRQIKGFHDQIRLHSFQQAIVFCNRIGYFYTIIATDIKTVFLFSASSVAAAKLNHDFFQ